MSHVRQNICGAKQWAQPNLFRGFLSNTHKTVILSEAHHRFTPWHSSCSAESKDPGGAYLTDAAQTFSTTEAREPIDSGTRLMVTGTFFRDHANEVELLFAPPAFELFER